MERASSVGQRLCNFLDSTYSLEKLLKFSLPCLALAERWTGAALFGRWRSICSIGRGMLCPSLVYRFWRVAYSGDSRSYHPISGLSLSTDQENRLGQAAQIMIPSDRTLCLLLGLLALGRFVLFLSHRWIQEINLGSHRASFAYAMTGVGTVTSIWGLRHNSLEKEWIDSQRGIASETDIRSQETCRQCGTVQASCDLIDNLLQLGGYLSTSQLFIQMIACSAQLRARWEKA
jgi:hypothetical protein